MWETCLRLIGDIGQLHRSFASSDLRRGTIACNKRATLSKIAFFCVHTFTPICEATLPSLKWDLAVTRRAVEIVLSRKARVVYAQVIHPGHHAGPAVYGGFCFINNAAIAARLLQRKYKKVAVVDVDYHHGNGTMAVFWNDPTVLFASLHGNPNYEYPFTSGYANQVGGPGAEHTTINVPLPVGCQWDTYKMELREVIERVTVFGASARGIQRTIARRGCYVNGGAGFLYLEATIVGSLSSFYYHLINCNDLGSIIECKTLFNNI